MTTMGKQVTRAGHDTPNTSTIASKKAARGRRCGVSLRSVLEGLVLMLDKSRTVNCMRHALTLFRKRSP